MRNSRANAPITGILFILGTVPVMVAIGLWGQSISSPDYLSLMAAHSNDVLLFALSIILMGLACAGIGISMYPILKPHGEALAMGVVGLVEAFSPPQMLLMLPILLQEMLLAVWLIVKEYSKTEAAA